VLGLLGHTPVWEVQVRAAVVYFVLLLVGTRAAVLWRQWTRAPKPRRAEQQDGDGRSQWQR
jgi:hypothetical protein